MRSLAIALLLSCTLLIGASAQQQEPSKTQASEPAKTTVKEKKQKNAQRSEAPESNASKSESALASNSTDEPQKPDVKKESPDAARPARAAPDF